MTAQRSPLGVVMPTAARPLRGPRCAYANDWRVGATLPTRQRARPISQAGHPTIPAERRYRF